MHSCLLVSGPPRSLPPLLRSPAPPCLPFVEGRQRAAPHSSLFPPTTAPLQTLHMDMWGSDPVCGTVQERYFLLVIDNYTRYTTVFPLGSKADISSVLIPWILATRHQLRERFQRDLPILRLHSDRGETSPTLHWTGKVGDASAFWVWGALSLVRDSTASKLSPRTLRCAFLGFPIDASPWQFYYPRSRCVFSSQDVTFDESVCFYRLHPYASHPVPRAPLFLIHPPRLSLWRSLLTPLARLRGGDLAADDTAATHRSPRLDTPLGFPPRPSSPPLQLVAVDTGAAGGGDTGGEDAGGAGPGGAETGGAETGGDENGGAGSKGAETRGAETGGAGSGGAKTGGATSPSGGGAVGAPAAGPGRSGAGAWSYLDARGAGDAGGTAGAGDAGTGGTTGGAAGAGATGARGAGAAGAGGATGGSAGAGGAGAASAGGTGAGGTGGAGAACPRGARPRGAEAVGSGGAAGAGCWCNPTVCIRLVVRVRACM
ncbi:unnamed protein product, partial [Closterium sp. NIES-54]